MTEWLSPIDGHRHFSDAGRAECAVCELEAERDRLRAVVGATATDARVLVYDRHAPYDVGEQLDGSADGTDG